MANLPHSMPRPDPDMDDAGFWQACAEKRLSFQACADCGEYRHPPSPICAACHATGVVWINAPSIAEIYTYTVIHHASHPAVEKRLPYIVAVVVFPDLPKVRFVSNVTHVDPDNVRIGMRLRLWWDDIGDGMHLPVFKPAQTPSD